MPRLDRPHARRAILLGAALVISTLSCGRDVTGPADGTRLVRGFSFDARFGPDELPRGVASDLVPFTKVRVVLVNSLGKTVVDRVIDFPSNVDEVPLTLDVPLTSGSAASGESMSLSLAFVNAAGDTVFRGGPQQVTVAVTPPGGEPPPPPQIPVAYTGPGAAAASVVITPASDTVLSGDAFAFTAVALDGQGSPIANTPIAWRSATPAKATITVPGSGAGTTLPSRGPALIIANLLSGPADTVVVEIEPRASSLGVISGNNQSTAFNAPLAQPVVVRVTATDNLPMAGVTVNFAVASGGGSVSAPSAVTDANGLAQVAWTAGDGLGAQTVSVTSVGLTGSPLTITANAPVVELLHHFPFASGLTDVAGASNGALFGAAAVSGGNLVLDGTSSYAQFDAWLVPTAGSYSVSLFAQNAGPIDRNTTFLSQGQSGGPGLFLGYGADGVLRAGDGFGPVGLAAPTGDGLFHHYVLVVDSAANQTRFYVDGALRQTVNARLVTAANGTPTRLGRQFDPAGEYVQGALDEVRIYRGALSAATVQTILTGGVSAPDRLVFSAQASNVVAGAVMAPAVVVRAEDPLGNLRTGFTGAVTLSIPAGANPGGATLGGTLTVNAVGGIATFANLTLDAAGSGYRLAANASGLTEATSAAFDVSAGAVTALVFTQQPTNALPSTSLAPAVVVAARDALGNVVTGYTGAVTLAFGTNPAGAVLGGTLSVNAVAGVATFANVTVDRAGAGFTLVAQSVPLGITSAPSASFSIIAGAATVLDITQQPSTAVAGFAFTPAIVVTARDGGGNVATGFTDAVTLEIAAGQGALGGTVTVNAVAGVATFANAFATTTDAALRVRAVATGLGPDTTTAFPVGPSAPVQLVWVSQPSAALAGQPLVPAVSVRALDSFGNETPGYNGAVTVAIANNPGGATLGGTVTVNAAGGVATFSDLTVSAPGSGYTLEATAGGLSAATSAPFTITASVFANSWINAAGGAWSAAGNWSLGRAPIATDTVVINLDGTYAVTMDVNFAGSIVLVGGGLGVQTLAVGTRSLTVSNVMTLLPTGAVTLASTGILGGTGSIVNQGTLTTGAGTVNAIVSAPVTNLATWIAQGATSVTGLVTNAPGAMLRVQGSAAAANAALTVANGFTNDGAIELTASGSGYAVQLTVTNGTLVNSATGTITSLQGSNGTRTLAAQLDNQGTVLAPYDLTLARASSAHVNSGTITMSGLADLTVTQTGTAPSFTNTGTINLAPARSMAVAGGTLDLSAGQLTGATSFLTTTGAPTVRLTTATVQPRIGFAAGTVLPDPLVIPAGDSLRIYSGTFAPPTLTNDGTLFLEGSAVLTTALTTGTGSLIRVRGTSTTSAANVTITNGFTNTATLQLTTESAGYSVQLNVTNGSLVNASTGTIESLQGANGSRTLAAQLDNQGTVLVPYELNLARASAAHLNSGTITMSGVADLTVTQTGTTPSFTNTGTITLAPARSLAVAGGTLDLSAGLVAGYTSYLTTTGAPTVRFTTATVQPRIGLAAGAVLPDPFVVPAGDSLRIYAGTFAPPTLTNDGTLFLEGSAVVTTALTTGTGSLIRVRGTSPTGSANVTITNGFTNTETIQLTTESAGYSVQLNVTNGSLVNASTGTITSLQGANGSRTLAAQLDNQGTVLVPYDLVLARASAAHVNSGTITTSGTADLTVTQSGTTPSFTNTGTITLAPARSLAVAGGTLDLSAGLVAGYTSYLTTTGAPTVRFTTATVQPRIGFAAGAVLPDPFVIPAGDSLRIYAGTFAPPTLTNNGTLFLEGSAVVTTALTTGAGSLIRVRGTATTSSANATITNGFTNTETIQLTAESAGYSVQLNVTNGPLVNASTGTITSLQGANGSRTLAAQLENQGTVLVPYDLTLARASATHVNSGTITMSGVADLVVTQTGTTPSFTNTGTITLAPARSLAVAGGTLDLSAGLLAGYTSYLTTTGTPTVRFTTATVQPRIGLAAGAIVPDPFVIPAGDSLRIYSGTFAPPTLTNNGTLFLEGSAIVTTALTTGPGSLIRVRGTSTTSSVNATITNGFTNTETIQLTTESAGYSVQLNVTNGTLLNASTGTIESLQGANGSRTLAAQLDNQGTLLVPYDLTLARASAAHVNSGTITTSGTADLTVTQSGTTPSFTNTGTITLAPARSLAVAGGTLDLSAGLVAGYTSYLTTTGAPTVRFTTATVQPRIGFAAGTVLPDPFVIPAGDSLRIYSGTFAPPSLTNSGTLFLEGSAVVNTALTTGPGSLIRVRGTSTTSSVNATITNGFTNTASLELTTESAGYSVQLNVTNGTLVNASTGTITSLQGATGSRTLAAQLDNQGTVLVPYDLTLARASAAHVNSGTITMSGVADLVVTQTGTTPSFANTGTITLAPARSLAVAGGTLDLSAGLVAGYTSYLTTTGTPTVRFTTATVQPRIGLAAGAIVPDPFVIPAGDSLRIYSGTFAPPSLTNNGTLFLEGTAVVNTALTTGPGSLIRVRGTSTTSNVNATITNGFTNTASLELTTETAGYSVQLNVTNGSLVNASTGTITSLQGATGSRTLAAQLDNQGTVLVPYDLTLARASSAHVNSGTITMSGVADLTVTQSGTTPSFTNTGTITLAPARSLAVSGGTLDLSAGLVGGYTSYLTTTGTPTVRFTTATVQPRIGFATGTVLPDPFVIPAGDSLRIYAGTFAPPTLTNNGFLSLEGNAALNTALTTTAGSLIAVRGTSVTGNASATITNGFTNAGIFRLVAEDAGYSVGVSLGANTLTNAVGGTIEFLTGSLGTRSITAGLIDNAGTFSVTNTGTITGPLDQRGALTVAATRTLTVTGLTRLLDGSVTTVLGAMSKPGGCTQSGVVTLTGTTCP